jgi:hypothetical protein
MCLLYFAIAIIALILALYCVDKMHEKEMRIGYLEGELQHYKEKNP